jgi:hypothetical protein
MAGRGFFATILARSSSVPRRAEGIGLAAGCIAK